MRHWKAPFVFPVEYIAVMRTKWNKTELIWILFEYYLNSFLNFFLQVGDRWLIPTMQPLNSNKLPCPLCPIVSAKPSTWNHLSAVLGKPRWLQPCCVQEMPAKPRSAAASVTVEDPLFAETPLASGYSRGLWAGVIRRALQRATSLCLHEWVCSDNGSRIQLTSKPKVYHESLTKKLAIN